MAQKTGCMSAEERRPAADIPASMKKSDMPWYEGKQDADRMRAEVRDLEEDLVANVAALRYKLSVTKMRAKAKDELREFAVKKPKAAFSTAGHTSAELLRKFLEISKDQPVIPIAISTIFVGIGAIRRALGRR